MNEIRISLAEVSETAAKIRRLNQAMYDDLCEMKKEMNALDGSWISDGSREIRSRFNMFANRFEKQKEVIESYAGYLDLVSSSYDTLESAITGNATGMQY